MDQKTTAKKILVLAIVSADKKRVFIGKSTQTPSRTYRYHQRLRSPYTKEIFAQTTAEPTMYILEELYTTEELAHRHCIAWWAYMEAHGFECIGSPSLRDGAADMLPETNAIFDRIRAAPIEMVLSEQTAVPIPAPKKAAVTVPASISFAVSADVYEKIALAAKERGLPVATYCRQVAADGCFVSLNFTELRCYVDAVRTLQAQAQDLSLALYRYGACNLHMLQALCEQLQAIGSQQQDVLVTITEALANLQEDLASARN